MSSFDIFTHIFIQIYAPHPKGESDFSMSYQGVVFPPFTYSGLIIDEDGGIRQWRWTAADNIPPDMTQLSLPPNQNIPVAAGDQVFTRHMIQVANRTGIYGAEPCLKAGPTTVTTLPSLTSGIVDTQSISFTLTNPNIQQWFSDDFMITQADVFLARGVGNERTFTWKGFITRVSFREGETHISARPTLKRLDQRANFGFAGQTLRWGPEYSVPIIAARLIPYSVRVEQHTPQVVSPYANWRQDYALLLRDFEPPPPDDMGGGDG